MQINQNFDLNSLGDKVPIFIKIILLVSLISLLSCNSNKNQKTAEIESAKAYIAMQKVKSKSNDSLKLDLNKPLPDLRVAGDKIEKKLRSNLKIDELEKELILKYPEVKGIGFVDHNAPDEYYYKNFFLKKLILNKLIYYVRGDFNCDGQNDVAVLSKKGSLFVKLNSQNFEKIKTLGGNEITKDPKGLKLKILSEYSETHKLDKVKFKVCDGIYLQRWEKASEYHFYDSVKKKYVYVHVED